MNNNKTKSPALLAAQVLLLLGITTYLFSDALTTLISLLGFADFAYIARFILPAMAPMGLVLLVYAQRHRIRDFLVEVRQQGITKTLEAIAQQWEKAPAPQITDPLASTISWKPIKPQRVHLPMKLHQPNQEALVFCYRSWPFYRASIFILIAISLAALPYWVKVIPLPYLNGADALIMLIQDASAILLVLGVILVGLSLLPWLGIYQETIIDKRSGTIEQRKPWFALRTLESKSAWLRNAHALQLLSFKAYASHEDATDPHYEMNLVLNDGKRLYLMSSDSLDELLRDAQITADYLNLPLWNRTHIIYDAQLTWLQNLDEKDR